MLSHKTAIYEQDFYAWVNLQITLLKAGKNHEIDTQHLIEELEEMGKSNVRELESRFIILIAHLLKWQFQLTSLSIQWQDFEGKSWRNTIIEQRVRILRLLRKIPSLKHELNNAVADAYPDALSLASKETKLSEATFPATCPYTIAQLLDDNFYPNNS